MPHTTTTAEPPLTDNGQAFENTSTNVAAAQMRNHLTHLAESVKDAEQKKVGLSRSLWLWIVLIIGL